MKNVPGSRTALAALLAGLVIAMPLAIYYAGEFVERDLTGPARGLAAEAGNAVAYVPEAQLVHTDFASIPVLPDPGAGDQGHAVPAYFVSTAEGTLLAASTGVRALLRAGARLPSPSDTVAGVTRTWQLPTTDNRWDLAGARVELQCGVVHSTTELESSAMTLSPNLAVRALPGTTTYQACVLLDPAKASAIRMRWWFICLAFAVVLAAGIAAIPLITARYRTQRLSRLRDEMDSTLASEDPELLADNDSNDELSIVTSAINDTIRRLQDSLATQRQFVADAAHELRSPIATMISTLEVAQAYPHITDNAQVTEITLAQARRLEQLVQDLLLLARMDAKTPVRSDPVDLQTLAEEVAVTARPSARVPIEVSGPADGVGLVRGDDEQLRRCLTNLVDNAIRHAVSRVDLTVSAEPGVVTVEVANDGKPIPDADAERIFTRFTRLDDARARDSGGSGLGLAIARDVARRHGGELMAIPLDPGAQPSKGRTVFRLTVPAAAG